MVFAKQFSRRLPIIEPVLQEKERLDKLFKQPSHYGTLFIILLGEMIKAAASLIFKKFGFLLSLSEGRTLDTSDSSAHAINFPDSSSLDPKP